MDLRMGEELRAIGDMVRDWAKAQAAPHALEWDGAGAVPAGTWAALGELGLTGLTADESVGGTGLGLDALVVAVEELAAGDGGLAWVLAQQNAAVLPALEQAADPSAVADALAGLVSGAARGAWAAEESGVDEDLAFVATTATAAGDQWTLHGRKPLVVGAAHASVAVVFARTGGDAGGPGDITAFAVPVGAGGAAVEASAPGRVLGLRSVGFGDLVLDGVVVPDGARLGDVGGGAALAGACAPRLAVAAGAWAVGIGRAALDAGARYALERKQFGKPIGRFQGIQQKLADCATELDAARLLTHRAARGLGCAARAGARRDASMAALFAGEAARRAADEAVQIHGGVGYTREYVVERLWRDARFGTLAGGASETHRREIAAAELGR